MKRVTLQDRGFTVIEIMVTVGILVLIAAGVSSIFTSISDTVNTGKRVAEINRFSAQLERVMRRDFERMTRDGYLVIASQYTSTSTGALVNAQLSASDRSDLNADGQPGHPRRIDEIMFFNRGEYETSRRAISPSMIARSTEAAIYYGHGQKRRPIFTNLNPGDTNQFFNPKVWDTNVDADARLGIRAGSGFANPNEYAADWSLLRQVTLLVEPQSAGQELPDSLFGVFRTNEINPGDRRWLEDSERQVALQPAARSIFNSLGWSGHEIVVPPANYEVPKWFAEYNLIDIDSRPSLRSSGLVDVVSEDLSSIKTILQGLSAKRHPSDYIFDFTIVPSTNINPTERYGDFVAQFWEDDASDVDMLDPSDAAGLNILNPNTQHVKNLRHWMINSLPSIWNQPVNAMGDPLPPFPLARVRYEDVPTRLIYNESDFSTSDADARERIYAEANQEMLGSSVFVPRCTEFIVEWSLGHVDQRVTDPTNPRYKRMLWYGLERWIDANKDGQIDTTGNGLAAGGDQRVASYYSQRAVPAGFNAGTYDRGPNVELITGNPATLPGFGSPPNLEIATFGYPDLRGNDWAWPKYIRVTISLADPLDPLIERTFQMVFDIPDATRN